MVIDVRRYAIVFLIDIDDTTIRYTSWRKYMPPNQPFDYYFENRWHWINISTLKDSGWVSRFVLSKKQKTLSIFTIVDKMFSFLKMRKESLTGA
jgi:hypothetical protein